MDALPRSDSDRAPLRIRLVAPEDGGQPRFEVGYQDSWLDLISAGVDDLGIRLTAEGMFLTIFARGDLVELDFPVEQVIVPQQADAIVGLSAETLDQVVMNGEWGDKRSPGEKIRAHLLGLLQT